MTTLSKDRMALDIAGYSMPSFINSVRDFLDGETFDFKAFENIEYSLDLLINHLLVFRLEIWAASFGQGKFVPINARGTANIEAALKQYPPFMGLLPCYDEIMASANGGKND